MIPDCRARAPTEALDARQRAELVRILAEQGPQAVEAWLRKEALRDPAVRARLERHRARLERSARAQREREQAEGAAAQTSWERRAAEHAAREAELRLRIAQAMEVPTLQLDATVAVPPRRVGWWAAIVAWWARLLAWKPGKRRSSKFQVGAQEFDAWELVDRDPGLVARARKRARRSWWRRFLAWWRRLLGLDDPLDDVRSMLLADAEEARRRGLQLAQQVRSEAERDLADLDRGWKEDAASRRKALEDLEQAQRAAEAATTDAPYRQLAQDVLGELAEAGLVDTSGAPTERLLQRFSAMLYDETLRGAAEGGPSVPGTYRGGEGEYERGPMATSHELGAMELLDTVVRARTRHPHVRHIQDDDVIVHRELRSTRAHVVVVFDQSNSMEEQDRLAAAKKVCLVLHRALRDDDPDHRIDLVAMGTSVRRVDLAHCWSAQPSGFTNQGAALREARRILETSDADRRLVYLITDGLPEARTLPDGRDVADRVDACMPDAMAAAKELRDMGGVRLLVLQLETKDPKYLDAARRIAKSAGGRVVGLDPKELARTLLVDLRAATARAT